MTPARFLFVAGYFTVVGYLLGKAGAAGKAAAALRGARDDMIRRDFLVANDMAMQIEMIRNISGHPLTPGEVARLREMSDDDLIAGKPFRDVSRETSRPESRFYGQPGAPGGPDVSRETSEGKAQDEG